MGCGMVGVSGRWHDVGAGGQVAHDVMGRHADMAATTATTAVWRRWLLQQLVVMQLVAVQSGSSDVSESGAGAMVAAGKRAAAAAGSPAVHLTTSGRAPGSCLARFWGLRAAGLPGLAGLTSSTSDESESEEKEAGRGRAAAGL